MGMRHHALVIYISGYVMSDPRGPERYNMPNIEEYRAGLPECFRRLLIGPILTATNGDYVVAFLPDGSKEGWEVSNKADEIRAELAILFGYQYEDGSSPYDIVQVWFGRDNRAIGVEVPSSWGLP